MEDEVEIFEAGSLDTKFNYPCGRMVFINSKQRYFTNWLKGIDQRSIDATGEMVYSLWIQTGDEEDVESITMGLTRTGAEALATELMKVLEWEKK